MPTVEVEGQQFEFEEGTPDAVMGEAIRKHFGQTGIPAIPPVPAPSKADLIAQRSQELGIAKPTIEPLRTMLSGMLAEPVAGLAGLATLPFADTGQSIKNIESVREALTYVPRTEQGIEKLQQVGQMLQPVAETLQAAEKGIGEAGYEAGGPLMGAAGEALPTAALTALGLAPARRALGITKVADVSKKLFTPSAKKLLNEAAPTIEGLKNAAREVYKEIDNTGAIVNSRSFNRLTNRLGAIARKEGFNKRIHPKVAAALDELSSAKGLDQKITDIDTLRKIVRGAAKSLEPDEARIGSMLVDRIDDFLDNVKRTDFKRGTAAEIGTKYKDARQLWRRAKKSEILEEAFQKASLQATGFENGIRVQFRSILNNKKRARGFTTEELDAMRKVVKGGTAENLAKMIGKFGFSEGQASNMLMGSAGVAGGAAVGGAAGAVAVPLIGQVSRKLAQKLTRRNAEAADMIVRAGNNGLEVTKAYIKAVPKAERSAAELSELLLRPNISLKSLKAKIPKLPKEQQKFLKDAVYFSSFMQSQKAQQIPQEDQ